MSESGPSCRVRVMLPLSATATRWAVLGIWIVAVVLLALDWQTGGIGRVLEVGGGAVSGLGLYRFYIRPNQLAKRQPVDKAAGGPKAAEQR